MVVIEDLRAFDLLARMEGEEWRQLQEAHPEDPYGYAFWRRAWEAKVAAGLRELPAPLPSFAERAVPDPVIYGAEGYRRYRVHADGEIVLDRGTGLPAESAKARFLGFRITGHATNHG